MATPVIDKPTAPKASYVLLHNVSWQQLEQLDINLQGTGARLTYLDGILEILSPLSDDHEDAKSSSRSAFTKSLIISLLNSCSGNGAIISNTPLNKQFALPYVLQAHQELSQTLPM